MKGVGKMESRKAEEVIIQRVETLETEIREFADELPLWAKYLAGKVLSGNTGSETDIKTSYSYLLEELGLIEKTEKQSIVIDYNLANKEEYKADLFFSKLENVEGVNALAENQMIEFSPNLTIIYGANGSGKSGYVRLLKNVFYSKAPEEIVPNIHVEKGRKPVNGKFVFRSNNTDIPLTYTEKNGVAFRQFAVFDGKGLLKQLAEKNEFEFRPAGLDFFANFTKVINEVEEKLNFDVLTKKNGNTANDLSELFEGDSAIKNLVQNLSASTKNDDLRKHTPFTEGDKTKKTQIQKEYDELLLASKDKGKKAAELENIKRLLNESKQTIENVNICFSNETLDQVNKAITDCIEKEAIAKTEGIESFKTAKIEGIGTLEWKNFVISAETFAKKQKTENGIYPESGDYCLLCHQPLSEDAERLIANYWAFIKSVAEENAKDAHEKLNKIKQGLEKINFELFPNDNTLTVWLTEKYPEELAVMRQKISEQKTFLHEIISDIQNKTAKKRIGITINIGAYTTMGAAIDASINSLKEDAQSKELVRLQSEKIFLEHKEKFNTHFSKFEDYVNNQIWIKKAEKANFLKRQITDKEKSLSNKYFNQKYVDTFNEECQRLVGDFGIEINHTGSAGKSFRQLKIKGKNPNTILSEGEQKVIAVADFLAEMQLSEINSGLVFDDPVTSLDNDRKKQIADRLVSQAISKQVIIFTHDLIFVSHLLVQCENEQIHFLCHWIENKNNTPGVIWLNNAPSYEKEYRNSEPAKKYYGECSKYDCPPKQKEMLLQQGFAALRTCYEVLVINDLFNSVVQRYNERVSIDALSKVFITEVLKNELSESFSQCCRYIEGHTHSDEYSYKKPEPKTLNEEILRYESIRKKIKDAKK
jgi:energy-coupling factor transporter ATP-binding protein EcfA2